jgi:hypothetical protein
MRFKGSVSTITKGMLESVKTPIAVRQVVCRRSNRRHSRNSFIRTRSIIGGPNDGTDEEKKAEIEGVRYNIDTTGKPFIIQDYSNYCSGTTNVVSR